MSRLLFDFLADTPLLSDEALENEFARLSEDDIEKLLRSYREYVISILPRLKEEVVNPPDSLGACFGTLTTSRFKISDLLQAAIYFDRAVCDDPLLPLTRTRSHLQKVYGQFFGYGESGALDKKRLASVMRRFKSLQPMVAGGYVKLAPLALMNEPPDAIPMTFSSTLFQERVPAELLGWFHKRARVLPMRKVEGGWIAVNEKLDPSRAIEIGFEGAIERMVFHLSALEPTPIQNDDSHLTFRQWIPEEPPPIELFEAWVQQSVNQFGGAMYSEIGTNLAFAAETNTMFLTNSPFAADLLAVEFGESGTIQEDLARLALQLDLPYLVDLPARDLMDLRANEDVFHSFRVAVQAQLRELRHESDAKIMARRLDDVTHELAEVQVRDVEAKLKSVIAQSSASLALGVASLAAIIPTGGLSLAGLFLAVGKAAFEGMKYSQDVRSHPAYLLWQAKGRTHKKSN